MSTAAEKHKRDYSDSKPNSARVPTSPDNDESNSNHPVLAIKIKQRRTTSPLSSDNDVMGCVISLPVEPQPPPSYANKRKRDNTDSKSAPKPPHHNSNIGLDKSKVRSEKSAERGEDRKPGQTNPSELQLIPPQDRILEPLESMSETSRIKIHYVDGDLFDCKPGSLLVHACNCKGSWGAGVARAFKQKYPLHFQIYKEYCARHASDPGQLVGRALLINPQRSGKGRDREDWVGCLFTREYPGSVKGKSTTQDVHDILDATGRAWRSLLRQVKKLEDGGVKGVDITPKDIVMPKINGGLFKVPWKQTEQILKDVRVNEGTREAFWVYDLGNMAR